MWVGVAMSHHYPANTLRSLTLRKFAFQVTHITPPWWPSSVWFIDRFEGAATPRGLVGVGEEEEEEEEEKAWVGLPSEAGEAVVSSFNTFRSPDSPPQAIQPWSGFHAREWSFIWFGWFVRVVRA